MEYIDLDIVRNNPKIFVGYSDITSMHMYFNQKAGLVLSTALWLSSNIVDKFDEETSAAFFSALCGEDHYDFVNPAGIPVKVHERGKRLRVLLSEEIFL